MTHVGVIGSLPKERAGCDVNSRGGERQPEFVRMLDLADKAEAVDLDSVDGDDFVECERSGSSLHLLSHIAFVTFGSPNENSDACKAEDPPRDTSDGGIAVLEHSEEMGVECFSRVVLSRAETFEQNHAAKLKSADVLARQTNLVRVDKCISQEEPVSTPLLDTRPLIEANSGSTHERATFDGPPYCTIPADNAQRGQIAGVVVRELRGALRPPAIFDVWATSSAMSALRQEVSSLRLHGPVTRLSVAVFTETSECIDLRLERSDVGLDVDISTACRSTRDELETEVPLMREALHAAGYDTVRIDVRTSRLHLDASSTGSNSHEGARQSPGDQNLPKRESMKDEGGRAEEVGRSGSLGSSLHHRSKFV